MTPTTRMLAKVEALKAEHVAWLLAGGAEEATAADYDLYRWWTELECYLAARAAR